MVNSSLFKAFVCVYVGIAQGFIVGPRPPQSGTPTRPTVRLPPSISSIDGWPWCSSRLAPIAAVTAQDSQVSKGNDALLGFTIKELGWDDRTHALLHEVLDQAGVSFSDLVAISVGYEADQIVQMLRHDFHIDPPLRVHQLRAAIVHAIMTGGKTPSTSSATSHQGQTTQNIVKEDTADTLDVSDSANQTSMRRPKMKSLHVNSVAARRKQAHPRQEYEYGLNNSYVALTSDLDRFYAFMTRPSPYSQEDPIRPATATVYLRHAKLFLGWYLKHYDSVSSSTMKPSVSLDSILPSSDKGSAAPFIEYVLWLRNERLISASYEANVLRGLTKLVKFRFATESESAASGIQSYTDVPLVAELRKLHRVANRQQKLSPRSSNEQLKWISWPDYLSVVEKCQQRAQQLVSAAAHRPSANSTTAGGSKSVLSGRTRRSQSEASTANDGVARDANNTLPCTPQQREAAIAMQRYLVLAIFASVPDRQRTIRELQLGKTLILDEPSGCYCIRHAPHEYKTGKTYGERPLLRLPNELTAPIDTFWSEWRQFLRPNTEALFVQPRTGNPLTRDSVYQLVSRACFEHTGKRTNPHLLRDMIVTHVRESSNASEKELEALALFMGHSLQMQRTSYDRRTLTSKVAPAVQLLTQVNAGALSSTES